MKAIRPADRAHRLAILDAERAELKARIDAAYEMTNEAKCDNECDHFWSLIDTLSDALAEVTGRRDELVMAA